MRRNNNIIGSVVDSTTGIFDTFDQFYKKKESTWSTTGISAVVITSSNSVNEGSSINFLVRTSGLDLGTSVSYNLVMVTGNLADTDFTSSVTASFTVPEGYVSTIPITVNSDTFDEGVETFKMEIYHNSILIGESEVITINDTSTGGGVEPSELYSFSTVTFSSGVTGLNGPNTAQAIAAMTGTPNPSEWNTNTEFFTTFAGIQLWTVPKTGTYRLTLKGASGGGVGGTFFPADPGEGATIITDVSLSRGTILSIVVGQRPIGGDSTKDGSAGGGGSWIYTGAIGGEGLIAVAGGGGGWGHGSSSSNGGNGLGGSATNDSRRVSQNAVVNGKTGNGTGATNGIGQGGGIATTGSFGGAAGGAGWLSNGTSRTTDQTATGELAGKAALVPTLAL